MRARTMKSDSRSFRSGNVLNATPDVGTVTSTGARPGRSASGKRSDSARTGKSFGSFGRSSTASAGASKPSTGAPEGVRRAKYPLREAMRAPLRLTFTSMVRNFPS